MSAPLDFKQLLGLHPSSETLAKHISSLTALASITEAAVPEVKSYPDVVYFNYYVLGLSLMFKPINGYKPKTGLLRDQLKDVDVVVDGIDIYNVPKPKTGSASESKFKSTYASCPISPVVLTLSHGSTNKNAEPRPSHFEVKPETTGKEFVETMGEPDRKGGGAGPSSGSIGIWCEWSKDGVMVEFGGDESRGPQAWERGKDAVWKIISIFPPKTD
ncbi:uncharacterized protein LAESUDRAFT_726554 [Laetiporus sulphureus 93-53]|uniref:Uncharacterized protein n=1 Tax=Laetiporus sulphureus 93-53 TaxID=1314785 RepID=A0A165E014_9APHY|nr:uncharacterized protein LAESUDRAFT_726554 [Laetiporus sulphureus 93-53]KZT05984.1 hypothetical protein LAESUDRAFT_726554 [Laetiporus sulphureus 93-53]